jgi:phosphate transport system substrate-binding protein
MMVRNLALVSVAALALAACDNAGTAGDAGSRDQIRVVGSSTVYPFTTLVGEQFVASHPGMKAPVVESTGTGGGMKLFCAGVGASYPDIEDASRRMKASEYATCKANGVEKIIEAQVGIDGIAIAAAKNGPNLALTPALLYRALAANVMGRPNTFKTWKDVDPSMPATPIQVYGPPSTSGTRDAFAELILAKGCKAIYPAAVDMEEKKPDDFAKNCTTIRQDGAYIDAGENDNLIVQKLQSNPDALGIFGYSYLQENQDKLNGMTVAGVAPTYNSIADGSYPGARPLFIYVKKSHIGAVKGLPEFLETYASLWAPNGPLVKHGLIAAPANIRDASAKILKDRTALDPKMLH